MIQIPYVNSDKINKEEWELWYQDNFDMTHPRILEKAGCGLREGLRELWAHHLYETIRPNGFIGFSRFNLWLKQRRRDIVIVGDEAGQLKLRCWVFGDGFLNFTSGLTATEKELLTLISEAHCRLVLKGKTSEWILSLVVSSPSIEDFFKQIKAALLNLL